MDENIQEITEATPEAEQSQSTEISNDFYVVSNVKFITLFICTFGVYPIYWFYKNWQLQKAISGESCWPIMRGIFYIFFTHNLFRRIDKKLVANRKEHSWDFENIATFVVVLTLSANILNRLSGKNIGSPFTDIAGLILVLVVGGLLLNVQKAINIACNDPEGKSNDRFTPLNYVWITLGTILIIFIFIGLFFTQDAPVY